MKDRGLSLENDESNEERFETHVSRVVNSFQFSENTNNNIRQSVHREFERARFSN